MNISFLQSKDWKNYIGTPAWLSEWQPRYPKASNFSVLKDKEHKLMLKTGLRFLYEA